MKTAPRPSSPVHGAPSAVEVSIVMPCLNEAETLATCIAKAREAIEKGRYSAEIIVADNGSSDGSQLIARELGAMPWSHRWLGNPVLTRISRIFFHAPVGDTHCGLRAFTKDAYCRMRLRATGMEFASEMVIK